MSSIEVVAALLMVVGVLGIVVPILPGLLLIVGAVLLWALVEQSTLGWVLLSVTVVLYLVGSLLQWLVPGKRMRAAGVRTSTLMAGVVAAIAMAFVIPVVGLFVGFVLGVYAAERHRVGSDAWPSTKAALRAVGLSILIEMVAGLAATLVWVGGVLAT